ncbi:MAG: ATP-binding cassette domain-containing protein [Actinomycetota bacterium]|nr:ATP-binding cassette domain-containing protein [Actinomycetota bacterium]
MAVNGAGPAVLNNDKGWDMMVASDGAVLEVDGLFRSFGDIRALNGLSFAVPPGEVFGFLGPNGSGKSTTMRAILHLVSLDAGEVRWNGRPYGFELCRRIGYMPEERGLYATMRIGDQLEYLGCLHGLDRTAARRQAGAWLDRLGVGNRAADKLEALSLGNQQRVQLAAALLHDPPILVLDEPFSGLDPVGVDELATVLAEQAAAGKTLLFSSHQLDLVEHLCQSVAIVNDGRLVASGPVRQLAEGCQTRLVVAVEGDHAGSWAEGLSGVEISENDTGQLRLVLAAATDPQDVLAAALAAGRVRHFAYETPRLSEVFREAVRCTERDVGQS